MRRRAKSNLAPSRAKSVNSAPHRNGRDRSPSLDSLADEILYLQRTAGNRAVTRLIQAGSRDLGKSVQRLAQAPEDHMGSAVGNVQPRPPGISGVQSGIIQRFRMYPKQRRFYKRMAAFVENEMPKLVNFKHLMKAMNEAGRNVGSKAKDYKKDFAWNAGPWLNVKRLRKGRSGQFAPGTNVLKIQKPKVREYEKDKTTDEAKELWLENTIIHEYVHYLADGKEKQTEEYGFEYEEKAYGVPALSPEYAVKGEFGTGTWEIKVVSKGSTNAQRFKVIGATRGDGTYPGKVGSKIKVTRGRTKPFRWRLEIEHQDAKTKNWKASRMRKHLVSGGAGDVTIRSDDLTDRDFDDLVLHVKQTSWKVETSKTGVKGAKKPAGGPGAEIPAYKRRRKRGYDPLDPYHRRPME